VLHCLAGSVLRHYTWPSLAFDPTKMLGTNSLLASAAACCYKLSLFKPCFLCADSMEELTGQLGETGNQSATRGYRTTEPARIAGEGRLEQSCISCLPVLHCTAPYDSAALTSRHCSVCHCLCCYSVVTRRVLGLCYSLHLSALISRFFACNSMFSVHSWQQKSCIHSQRRCV